ncbi:pilus assembly protein TadG-related protein [Sphingomicrobium clamense]|uniref:Putative Flp pilus-assembly TadG-like N-terminal domain-containing protein n=1 Tax=Sphingomicrobium clamense TaxID=2851013 RepID=A0ABS6V3C9_9SPHN|nr:pilus assembly protein TadG-related protein [Sphingomicrobium sp. B8]MBW0144059.1 hypothetical protein [Sphingomicrobium sp. B8]
MMARWELVWNEEGAIAPTLAVSLFGLLAAGGIAFDYARMASLDTELQNAADQAALAAATQLDGVDYACSRAKAAARRLVENKSYLSNDGGTTRLWIDETFDGSGAVNSALTYAVDDCAATANITFYESYNTATDTYGAVATTDETANVVEVTVGGRSVNFALTPVVAAVSSGDLSGTALASISSAICKTPPVMLCNPQEPAGNTNDLLPYNPAHGVGLRLVTGDATVPGNFGWLEAQIGNGANALKGALGYNTPPGVCQNTSGVTTKPGMTTSVLSSLNTRHDVFANGSNCPNTPGGVCSPAVNTRKDLTCVSNASGCTGNKGFEDFIPFDPLFGDHDGDTSTPDQQMALPSDGSLDPEAMGYPHDFCHTGKFGVHSCDIEGTGQWDRDAYFRVNYGWNNAQWKAAMGWTAGDPLPRRYDVYRWEIDNPTHMNGTDNFGIDHAQQVGTGNNRAFSRPADGVPGVDIDEDTGQPDRRVIAVAVLNCQSLDVKGKSVDVPVATWINVFLVEPSIKRGSGSEPNLYTREKDVYVEYIEEVEVDGGTNATVVRRDKPYLLR